MSLTVTLRVVCATAMLAVGKTPVTPPAPPEARLIADVGVILDIFAALNAGAFFKLVDEYAPLTDVLVSTASVEPVAFPATKPVAPAAV